ncbi:uncharacterized protein DS421_3g98890 [Arachis hypogaea]|nr:uncharacterized protein DS421_3g98890 [Arachis hypogaea]
MIASLQFLLSIMLVMLLFCMAKVSCADPEAKIHDHVTGSEIVEQSVRLGAVHTQGRRYAQEHVEHAVQGASVFHQGLMATEKCVEGVTLTWLLMATNPSAPRI